MILLLKSGTSAGERGKLEELARAAGLRCRYLDEEVEHGRRIVVLEGGGPTPDPDLVARAHLWPGVERLVSLDDRHPLCAAATGEVEVGPRSAASNVRPLVVGPRTLVWIAGPCTVEDPDVLGEIATRVARAGASMLRGGAFKPRTSPYSFQGHGRDGLLLLSAVARDLCLPLVTEVLDPRDVDFVVQHADLVQVGSRSMQNFALLREVGAAGRPVLLKRGMAATLEEVLSAAEYVFGAGCKGLVLCERGVRGFDPDRRNVLDLAFVAALRERTRLPVLVDPSHATGRRALVIPMAKAAVAAGADGVMVEVHSRPQEALSDGAQALLPNDLVALGDALRALARLEGREMPFVSRTQTEETHHLREVCP